MLNDKLYGYFVRKNGRVWYEYERYVREHMEEHRLHKFRHLKILLKLNWFYRVKKGNTPYLYWDVPLEPITEKKEVIKEIENKDRNDKKVTSVQNKRNPLLPYIENAESEGFKRAPAHQIVKKYMEYEVVSFDIFDTLILRPFDTPQTLFILLEKKWGIKDFKKIRIEAEKNAREKAVLFRGNREVTIYDIYEEIEYRTGLDKRIGADYEYELEKKYCFANPYFKRILDILISNGKRFVAVSDMYYSKKQLEELLYKCGLIGFEDIFISCEYNCGKNANGELFNIMRRCVNTDSIIHIGDNYKSDIENAKKCGLEASFYKNVNVIGNPQRADGMTDLVGAAYKGIVNAHIYNGLKKYSVYHEYGYIYGGLYVLGYMNFIAQYVIRNKFDKVLFVSRDGDIYHKVFNMLYPNIENEYVYWSRMACLFSDVKDQRNEFIDRTIKRHIDNDDKISVKALLKSLDLEEFAKYFHKYKISENEYLHIGNKKVIENLFLDHFDEIIEKYNFKMEQIKKYYGKVVSGKSNVAVVDVGWTGSNVIGLCKCLTEKWGLCKEARGFVVGANTYNLNFSTHMDCNALLIPYMFSQSYNRAEHSNFRKTPKATVLFEIMTQACSPSFKYIDNKGDFVFDIAEAENYQMIKEIHVGVIAFVYDYIKFFRDDNYMMNISGYDAYMPFRKLFRDINYFKKFFGDFVINENAFSDTDNQEFTNLKEILTRGEV